MLIFEKWPRITKNIVYKSPIIYIVLIFLFSIVIGKNNIKSNWPDGSQISPWFSDISRVNISGLNHYVITDYGIKEKSDLIQTEKIQSVIDLCSKNGGGVIVIPNGTFFSGSLFFKPKTHLLIEEGGELKGSDRIRDFKIVNTRIEGQTINYFAALVNADKLMDLQ